jgi:nucleoside-diphosphate-sugar epimerase
MRVLVTGGAGFIGSHLAERLAADGHEVLVLDNLSTGRRENLEAGARPGTRGRLTLVEGDVRDEAALARVARGCEVVYHQAALAAVARSVEDPLEVYDVNVRGTLRVLEAARAAGVRRVVFASSASVYGDAASLPKREDQPPRPRSPYAATKAAGEGLMSAWQATYGLETVSLRFFNVYGPRQSPRSRYAAVIPAFLAAVGRGEQPVIYGDGQQTRDFTWVEDLVEGLVLAATAPDAPTAGPINLGGGQRVSIARVAELVCRALGVAAEPRFEAARPGDLRHSLADVSRAQAALGWAPTTPLAEGIARLAAAFASGGVPEATPR